jgi:glucose-6-phosphate 1-epimerase
MSAMTLTAAELTEQFGIEGHLHFEERHGLRLAVVRVGGAEGEVYLHGAHVTHWKPANELPAIFLSKKSDFAADKAIRGGIPICFPWFGARSDGKTGPSHGFARLSEWELAFAGLVPDAAGDCLNLTFTLGPDEQSRSLGFDRFRVVYEVFFAPAELKLRLTVANLGDAPLKFEEALHSYFAVEDVRKVSLEGLESAPFLDKTDGMRAKTGPAEALRFAGETDRVYPGNEADVRIEDEGNERAILVAKAGSRTTVVWNPWSELAIKLTDLPDEAWPEFCCVETANAGADAVTLAPGESHAMEAVLSVAKPTEEVR